MPVFKNILVATDTRFDEHLVVEEAAVFAQRENASMKIVDVVPDFPCVVRLALKDHQSIRKLVISKKAEQLEALAEPLRRRGIRVETHVLSGKTSVEIIRQVLRGRHDLVFRFAKGKDSRRKGFFGTTACRLLRDCPCAVWLATPAASHQYHHVMACVDTSTDDPRDAKLNEKVYESAAFVREQHNANLSIVHAWSMFAEDFLMTRTALGDFQQLQRSVHERTVLLLNTFLRKYNTGVYASHVHMLNGDTTAVLPAFARQTDVDLVVMGTVARSGVQGLVMGNTAEKILDQIQCSVLALKPDGFVSPIRLPERT